MKLATIRNILILVTKKTVTKSVFALFVHSEKYFTCWRKNICIYYLNSIHVFIELVINTPMNGAYLETLVICVF